MWKHFYFIFLVSSLGGVTSQLVAQQGTAAVIREVEVVGLINVNQGQVRKVYRPYIGQASTPDTVNELIDRLYALEYFDLISAEQEPREDGTIKLVVKVEERPKINKIVYRGASASFLSQLRQTVLIGTVDDYYYQGMLEEEQDRILKFYQEKGFVEAKVTSEVSEDPSETHAVVVAFVIVEGIRLNVREVAYQGNKAFSESQIRAIPNLKLTGLALLFRGEYNGEAIEQDKSLIELFYKKKGYLDFKVREVREEVVEEKKSAAGTTTRYLRLVFVLDEGQPYTMGSISVTGNVLYTTEEILDVFENKTGEVFDYLLFQRNFEALRSLYYDIGYVNNTIEYTEVKDGTSVSYQITIVERARALIEAIQVVGNEHTAEDVILREIPLRAGDVFSRQELLRGMKNLQYLEIFSSVVPDVQPGSLPGLLRVIVNVEEKFSVTANVKMGFSPVAGGQSPASAIPLTAGVQLQDQNFLGRNYSAGIQGEVGFSKQTAGVNFYNPRVFGSRWSAGFALTYTHNVDQLLKQDLDGNGLADPYLSVEEYRRSSAIELRENAILYDGRAESHSFVPSATVAYTWLLPVGLQLGRLQFRGGYSFSLKYLDYENTVMRPLDERQRQNFRTFLYGDVLNLRLAFDTRDVPSNPLSGVIASQAFALGGVMPTQFNRYYLTSRTRFDAYLPIFNQPVSEDWSFILGFSLHTALSWLLPHPFNPLEVNAFENGFVISSFTIGRGWASDYGELLWDNTLTLSWMIVRQIVNFEVFVDAIGLWREARQFNDFSIDDFRFGFGFGPRITLPQLPLGLYLVKLFRFEDGVLNSRPEEGFLGNGWSLALHIKIDPY